MEESAIVTKYTREVDAQSLGKWERNGVAFPVKRAQLRTLCLLRTAFPSGDLCLNVREKTLNIAIAAQEKK